MVRMTTLMERSRKIVAAAGLALALAGAAGFGSALVGDEAASSAKEASQSALTKGMDAPERIVGVNLDGEEVDVSGYLAEGPVALIFFRGSWCGYCVNSLKQFEEAKSQIEGAGGRVIAISPEKTETLANVRDKAGVTFEILHDPEGTIGRSFGVNYEVGARQVAFVKRYNGHDQLPLGATYVIGTDGAIEWSFTDEKYSKRADPSLVVSKIESLAG